MIYKKLMKKKYMKKLYISCIQVLRNWLLSFKLRALSPRAEVLFYKRHHDVITSEQKVPTTTFASFLYMNPDAYMSARTAFVSLSLFSAMIFPLYMIPELASMMVQVHWNSSLFWVNVLLITRVIKYKFIVNQLFS